MDTWLTHTKEKGLPEAPITPTPITPKKRGRKPTGRKKTCGIYIITNQYNNKVYIGKSIDIRDRFTQHRSVLRLKTCSIAQMQEDWNTHSDKFLFTILIECEQKELKVLEKQYIKQYLEDGYILYNTVFVIQDKTILNIKKEYLVCLKKVVEVLDKELITTHTLMQQLDLLS